MSLFFALYVLGRAYKQAADSRWPQSGFFNSTPPATLFSLMIYLTTWFLTQHVARSKAHLFKSLSISFPSLSAQMWAHSSLLLPVNWQPTHPQPQSTHTHTRSILLLFPLLHAPIFWNLYSTLLNHMRNPTPILNSSVSQPTFIGISHYSLLVSIPSAFSPL